MHPASFHSDEILNPRLILVTVIVAILVAWWLDHQRLAKEIRMLKDPWPGYKLDVF